MFDMIDNDKVPTQNQQEREDREGRSGDRLTEKWTLGLEEAFGEKGKKGEEGELFVKMVMEGWGWDVWHYKSEYDKQLSGKDLEFKSPKWYSKYSADVKHNITEYGAFYVETDDNGWLFKEGKVSHRIWHCNNKTGWMAWYDREEMKNFIIDNGLRNTGIFKIDAKMKLNFITRRRYESPKIHLDNIPEGRDTRVS
jgi:hypothetical protein